MVESIKKLAFAALKHPVLSKKLLDIKSEVYTKICDLAVFAVPSDEPITKEEAKSRREVPVKKGFEWAKNKFGACWFHIKGEIPDGVKCEHPVAVMSIGGEGLSYDGEETVDIITPLLSLTDVLQPPTAGKRTMDVVKDGLVDCYVDCGYNGFSGKFLNKAIFRYAYIAEKDDEICDFYYDYATLAVLFAAEEENFSDADKKYLKNILIKSHAFFKKGNLAKAKAELKKYYDRGQDYESVLYTLVGQAHLDLAWLWPERESKRKAVRTFTNAVAMIEKNPSYVFGASQAQMFEWVKDSHSELFEKIKKYVASGNIEIQGGMWVECDCNMPCGESLIRQFLYGEKFFKENFGKSSDVTWLPDAFGFPATFPQIIKGVGKKYFNTIKLTWNKINKFPYQSFYWVAPDGSKVLSHISPEGTYYNDGTPLAVAKAEKNNLQKETGRALIIYGAGDGGGGAGEGHIEIAKRSHRLYGSARTVFGSAESFFNDLSRVENLPEYANELYLEKHQGTLTSQSDNKKYNRFAERELHTLEWLSVSCGEKEDLSYYWKRLLFTQFHDVLPGSSIERVHKESVADLKEIVEYAKELSLKKAEKFRKGDGISALNPSPFQREEYITVDGKSYKFSGEGYSASPLKEEKPYLAVSDDCIENDEIKVFFDKNGIICSYLIKKSGKELNLNGLNKFVVFKDKKTRYNAWDIDMDYLNYPSPTEFVSLKTYIEGSKAIAETVFRYGNSEIKQKASISSGCTVRFDTEVNWQEKDKMLRAEFYPSVYSEKAECDIQFGSIKRSTGTTSDLDRAKFEICAHKYISVGKGEYFSIFSDSKYGYRAKDGLVSINLLRSPKYPDENCDMGLRSFSYAMDFSEKAEEVVKKSYNFSYPLIAVDGAVEIKPFVKVDCDNIIIETIKPAEGEGTVVRLYERFGKETVASLEFSGEASIADMLEREIEPTGKEIKFLPHEIKTLIIK